jgi:hypothetical protein
LKEAPKSGEEAKKPEPASEGTPESANAESPKKKSPVEITIWSETGEKIRTIPGAAKAGFNRVAWDLRYEPTEEVRIRTTPAGNPHIWEEKRFRGKDRRGVYYYGIDAPKRGPLVVPGTYTVKMTFDGREETQKLVVRKDPNSAGSEADVEVSSKFARAVARDVDATAGMINELEWTRLQLESYKKMLRAAKAPRPEIAAAEELEKKIRSVEDRLLQPTLAEADLKSFRGPLELYLKLVWLLAESETGGGDVSGNADFPPTQAEREVYELLGKQLAEVRRDFDELNGKTIPAFNETTRAKGFALMTVKEPPAPRTEKPEEPDED